MVIDIANSAGDKKSGTVFPQTLKLIQKRFKALRLKAVDCYTKTQKRPVGPSEASVDELSEVI